MGRGRSRPSLMTTSSLTAEDIEGIGGGGGQEEKGDRGEEDETGTEADNGDEDETEAGMKGSSNTFRCVKEGAVTCCCCCCCCCGGLSGKSSIAEDDNADDDDEEAAGGDTENVFINCVMRFIFQPSKSS